MSAPKDPELSGRQFEVETDHGAILDITIMPNGDHYVLDVTDRVSGEDVLRVLTDKTLPEIRNETDLNICLQILFEDEAEDDIPQVGSETAIADWENGIEPEDLAFAELQGFVRDVNAITADLQKTTLHTAVDKSGNDLYFKFGDVIIRVSFRYSPEEN